MSAAIEDWARNYVETTVLGVKLEPPPPPDHFRGAVAQRVERPGRPPELHVVTRTDRTVPRHKLANPRWRARLIHTFLHHELQAAELMCWAILAFPASPEAFRRGLLAIAQDEIRHMAMYRAHLTRLGYEPGSFPVRDWFWQRIPACANPLQFVALMGMGLEGSNLDHTRRFAAWFDEVGDAQGAALQRVVGDEEVAHVEFALHWFREWTGGLDFDRWRAALVAPLTPRMFQGPELDAERRSQAGFPDGFLDRLRAARTE